MARRSLRFSFRKNAIYDRRGSRALRTCGEEAIPRNRLALAMNLNMVSLAEEVLVLLWQT